MLPLQCPPGYDVTRLDDTHQRDGFACGSEALDKYLHGQLKQDNRKGISKAHVLLIAGTVSIVGFCTLANSYIPLRDLPAPVWKKLTRQPFVPATLIARLAIDRNHQNKGLGKFLMFYALETILRLSQDSASFAVIVDAKDEGVKKWYEKEFEFIPLPDKPLRLYLPMETVKTIFPAELDSNSATTGL